jgi:hypothetical protein
MKKSTKLLLLAMTLLTSLTVEATERNRPGGFAVRQSDGVLVLNADGLSASFAKFEIRPGSKVGSQTIQTQGTEALNLYRGLYTKYSKAEPDQVLTFMDRQIIYGSGVACERIYSQQSWGLIENGDLTPQPSDFYHCRFEMDLHTGLTNAVGFREPRGGFGVSN